MGYPVRAPRLPTFKPASGPKTPTGPWPGAPKQITTTTSIVTIASVVLTSMLMLTLNIVIVVVVITGLDAQRK